MCERPPGEPAAFGRWRTSGGAAQRTGWAGVPGAMIAAVALAVLPVLLTMPETHPTLAKQGRARASLARDDGL